MSETRSTHLGVVEQVPANTVPPNQKTTTLRLSILRATQTPQRILDTNKMYMLHLLIDSNSMRDLEYTPLHERELEAQSIERINNSLIIKVSLLGKPYVLKCDKTMIYTKNNDTVVSEVEKEATSLNLVSGINSPIKNYS